MMDLINRGKDVSVVWDIGVDCLTPWGGCCSLDMAESINRKSPIPVTGFYLNPHSLERLPKADNLEFEMLTTQKPLTPRIDVHKPTLIRSLSFPRMMRNEFWGRVSNALDEGGFLVSGTGNEQAGRYAAFRKTNDGLKCNK